MGHWPRGHAAAKRQIHFTADLSKPQTAAGPALPEEHRMETVRMATRHRVSQRRLMLHIKQTKEIPNLIVSHSLVHPNISKSDSLSLLESKTWYNQISLNLFYDLWSGNISLTLSILLKEIFICHFKSNLVSAWFSKRLVGMPHVIGLHHRCVRLSPQLKFMNYSWGKLRSTRIQACDSLRFCSCRFSTSFSSKHCRVPTAPWLGEKQSKQCEVYQ